MIIARSEFTRPLVALLLPFLVPLIVAYGLSRSGYFEETKLTVEVDLLTANLSAVFALGAKRT